MKRSLGVALATIAGTLATGGVAAADIGDIQRITVDQQLFGTASSVEVTGQIRCQATIEYGLWVGVAQDGTSPPALDDRFIDFEPDGNSIDNPSGAEAVGAFGPSFDPPVGVSDDSPCSQALSSYDVVVQQNRDSDDFQTGAVGLAIQAGSSAQDGGRGPGPFIGDTFGLEDNNVDFDRTR